MGVTATTLLRTEGAPSVAMGVTPHQVHDTV
jgi:hypothetical protein